MNSRIKMLAETAAIVGLFCVLYALLFIAPELDAALSAALGRV
ncbi:hypothetical protein [uncultured Mediterranean phage uvDeep-CGR0-AD1-C123]|nr:hypothetical protein [uncultured Mediterranean phage uvDeep-CGR0-AD1-C123]